MRWIAATLIGLLVLSYALVELATPSTAVHPSPSDTDAGGLSILATTLRDAGYVVTFDGSTRPRLEANDVAVAPVLDNHNTPKEALTHVKLGGRAFVLGIPSELQPVADTLEARDSTGAKAKINATELSSAGPIQPDGYVIGATSWSSGDETIASLDQMSKGRLARLDYGALATNRFLGRVDNARVVLGVLATVAKPGDRLVFLAGGYGEAVAPGPFEAIGPWAVGALWQSLAILAAFGIVRGIRFGLSAPEVQSRRGARELLDAVAAFYARGHRTDAPLGWAARGLSSDPEAQAIAARKGVSEAEARVAMAEFEGRSKRRPR